MINHEKTVKGLAKALTSIADELPRIGLFSEFYPTEKMKRIVAELVVGILEFLTRAHKWYTEGKMKRAFHSFTQPFDLRYGDILANISRSSAGVKELANCGFLVEFRDFKSIFLSRLDNIQDLLSQQGTNSCKTPAALICVSRLQLNRIAIIMSATLDTNRRIDDLQFAQILQAISNRNIWSPNEVITRLQASRKNSAQNEVRLLAKTFWDAPRMRAWTLSKNSDILIIKSSFSSRQALRFFCVDVVEQLRLENIPVFLALGTSHEGAAAHSMTTTDLLKYLVCQVLDFQRYTQSEKTMSAISAAFSRNLSENEYFSLLEHALLQLFRDIYLIVDLNLLIRSIGSAKDFNWLSKFLGLFKSLERRKAPTCVVKVLLISYSNELPIDISPGERTNYCITARLEAGRTNSRRGQIQVSRVRQSGKSRFRKDATRS